MSKLDAAKFNSDPKHETERTEFDAMIEASLNRIADKKKKTAPPQEKGFVDDLIEGIFGARE